MEFSEVTKKQIINGFIQIFTRIGNKEYQKRVWINGLGPECDDFEDTVNDFFGECDSILENYRYFGVTEEQHSLLVKFHDKFEEFCDGPRPEHSYPPMFIDTPEWNEVVDMATEVLKAFNYKKP